MIEDDEIVANLKQMRDEAEEKRPLRRVLVTRS
jgi:hypothetical protein